MASNPVNIDDTHLKEQYEKLQQQQQEKLMRRKRILEEKQSKQSFTEKKMVSKQGTRVSEAFGINDDLNLAVGLIIFIFFALNCQIMSFVY